MRRAFLTRTSYEWEARFGAAGVPGAAHRSTAEWLTSPHARASGLVVQDEGTSVRPGPICWCLEEAIRQSGKRPSGSNSYLEEPELPPMAASRSGPGTTTPPASAPATPFVPDASPTSSDEETAPPAAAGGGWLRGLKVLDLANVIAGPTIGTMLARYGAEVLKVRIAVADAQDDDRSVFEVLIQRLRVVVGRRAGHIPSLHLLFSL